MPSRWFRAFLNFFVILILAVAPVAAQHALVEPSKAAPAKALAYPETRKVDVVDDYHGTKVPDPYRWLEDENAADTKSWIEAQNTVTFGYLEQIPVRAKIRERLAKLWNYERFTIPVKRGPRYVFSRNSGLQNQNVVYTVDKLDGEPKVLFDPNTWSSDGTVALGGTAFTDDGKLVAWATSDAGSDWRTWRVKNVETGEDLSDVIKWSKSGASWTHDNKGFFYSRYDEPPPGTSLSAPNFFQKLYYHKLGTPQAEDVLVYERPDQKDMRFGGNVTDDGKYLIINVFIGTARKNRVYYKDLTVADSPVVKLLDDFDASYQFLDNDGPVFWFRTDLDAPKYRVIAIDTRKPERANWKTVLPEAKDTLTGANIVNHMLVAQYLVDARSQVKIYELTGKFVRDVQLPGIGSAGGFGGKRTDTETFYTFSSFTTPGTIYRYDMKTGTSSVFRQPKVDFDANAFETKQVFYNSKDGTRVPMFLVYKKGLKLDGQNPTYLYGYGGFNISSTPSFSVPNLVWLEMGGVYALANLRGGGEYGKAWHEAGMKLKKQNVFDDFIAAAEWLIANKYTSTPRLAIGGGSNGGLLVGAVMTQRPDLFGATLPRVGVMDMLRFHKFTVGFGWTSDYGSPDDPTEFKAIYAYSPLHNLKPGTKYPPTLVMTADHDDRVVPAHSFKFAAALQAAHAGDAPVLIRVETRAGHGAGKPISKQIEEIADAWGFLLHVMNVPTI
jgi:prolyl oligopeptidase